jgi:hypothetical protein
MSELVLEDTTPPNPFICFLAISCHLWDGSPE